jgi:hypothetical protein
LFIARRRVIADQACAAVCGAGGLLEVVTGRRVAGPPVLLLAERSCGPEAASGGGLAAGDG